MVKSAPFSAFPGSLSRQVSEWRLVENGLPFTVAGPRRFFTGLPYESLAEKLGDSAHDGRPCGICIAEAKTIGNRGLGSSDTEGGYAEG